MRFGFDVDGVLANFVPRFQELVVNTTKRNLFEAEDEYNPPCWDWAELRGYRPDQMKDVWGRITQSPAFWYSLQPTDDCATLAMMLPELEHNHDVYYVTSRPGVTAKRQTEAWLFRFLPYAEMGITPTVLICSEKGAACKALKLDVYVDDYHENTNKTGNEWPATRSYLVNKSYNVGHAVPQSVARVDNLGAVFDKELV